MFFYFRGLGLLTMTNYRYNEIDTQKRQFQEAAGLLGLCCLLHLSSRKPTQFLLRVNFRLLVNSCPHWPSLWPAITLFILGLLVLTALFSYLLSSPSFPPCLSELCRDEWFSIKARSGMLSCAQSLSDTITLSK